MAQVDIVDRPALRLGAVRHVGPYQDIGRAFGRLGGIAATAGLFERPGAAMIAIYHDDTAATPAAELRSDAAIVVPDDAPIPAELTEVRLAGGRYARHVHVGPYSGLPQAWNVMRDWLPSSGHRRGAGPSYEHYVSDMRTTPPDELRTALYMPLA